MIPEREFVADVRPADGEPFRATVQIPSIATNFWDPDPGAIVRVLVNRKSRKVKFDKSDPTLDARTYKQAEAARFAAAASAPPGSADPRADERATAVRAALDRAAGNDPEQRLAKLDTLRDKGLVTTDEYAAHRAEIIGSV